MSILNIIIAISAFCVLIIAHEFGHFAVSKLLGVSVLEFSIGMGPLIWHKQKGETQYSVRAIPLGGFCKLEGEDPEDDSDEDGSISEPKPLPPGSFELQSPANKVLILVAGAFMNVLLCVLTVFIIYVFYSGMPVGMAAKYALADSGEYAVEIFRFFGGLFNGSSSTDDVVGVVGIVSIIGQQAQFGIVNVIYFMAMISLNLGIVNLLPIPALDGGRILFVILRALSRGKITAEAEGRINGIFMLILFGLMFFLIFRDIFTFVL